MAKSLQTVGAGEGKLKVRDKERDWVEE